MEGLSGQACWHFHDPQGGPGGCSTATYTGGWHTFGADWEPGSVTYYYDGHRRRHDHHRASPAPRCT